MGIKLQWEINRKEFFDKGLIEELYVSRRGGYSICLFAGWRLMALCIDPRIFKAMEEPFWFFITENDASVLIRHSADGSDRSLFMGALNKQEGVCTYTQEWLQEAIKIRAEVERGEREVSVSTEMLSELKESYIAANSGLVKKFGIPPRFSNAKLSKCLIASLLTPLGGPFWLLGRPIPAILCIVMYILTGIVNSSYTIVVISCVIFILLSFVLMVMLIGGTMKDGKGLYVVSVNRQRGIAYTLGLVEKYQKEPAE